MFCFTPNNMANLTELGNFGYVIDGMTNRIIGENKGFKSPFNHYRFSIDSFLYFGGHDQVTVLPRDLEKAVMSLDPYYLGNEKWSYSRQPFIRKEKITKKGFLGFSHTSYEERILRALDILEHPVKDEPLSIVQWGLPMIESGNRDGYFFVLTAYLGESQAQQVREAIVKEPGIVRETCRFMFPKEFSEIELYKNDKMPIENFPHKLIDVTFKMNPDGSVEYARAPDYTQRRV